MTLAALVQDAREAARLDRLLDRLQAEYDAERRKNADRARIIDRILRLVLKAVGRFIFHIGWIVAILPGGLAILIAPPAGSRLWLLLACMAVWMAGIWRVRKITSVPDFEALAMPSREGLLTARWIRQVPFFL